MTFQTTRILISDLLLQGSRICNKVTYGGHKEFVGTAWNSCGTWALLRPCQFYILSYFIICFILFIYYFRIPESIPGGLCWKTTQTCLFVLEIWKKNIEEYIVIINIYWKCKFQTSMSVLYSAVFNKWRVQCEL